jgi:hypothetical protein
VAVSPAVELDNLSRGQEVMLNEAMNVVLALDFESIGEVVTLKEVLADGERALVVGHTDEEKVVRLAEPLRLEHLRVGESLLLESRSGYVYERVPKSEVEELVPAGMLAYRLRLRNILVHGYLDIDHGRLFDELDWIESTETFAAAIDLWLEQNVDH